MRSLNHFLFDLVVKLLQLELENLKNGPETERNKLHPMELAYIVIEALIVCWQHQHRVFTHEK
jgi:hypothetical protein